MSNSKEKDIRIKLIKGEIDPNNIELFFGDAIKATILFLNKNIKLRDKRIPHFILNTGDEILYRELMDYEYSRTEVTDENFVYNEIPRCQVDVSEVAENETEFASVDEFIGEEAEVIDAPLKTDVESEAAFADVTEFAESENEVAGDDVDFADVSEVAGDESSNESRPSIDVCDFKNLRAIFEYLPENGKDSFVSNRIRMVVEYVIAKTSGKRGLLKTAKMWRKAAHLDNDEIQNDEDKVTAREVYDLVVYLKTLANELEDKEISKAICESADNVLQRIQL